MNKTQVSWLREYFPDLALVRLPVFGSRREFYRINAGQESKIVIVDRDREQFQLWLDRAELFSSLNVNVPRAEVFSEELDLIITQDLGAASVESLAQQAKTDRLQYYHQVIEVLVKWQLRFKRVPELAQQHRLRQYDFEYARSDTRLFADRYLMKYRGWNAQQVAQFDIYFDHLAEQTSLLPRTLMHRDFQAENIMWFDHQPWVIDFQACCVGADTYDLASLVFDNHLDLRDEERSELIEFFFSFFPDRSHDDLYPAALQRTLQALGAYAHLVVEQGKPQYEKYIPRAVEHLKILSGLSSKLHDHNLLIRLLK